MSRYYRGFETFEELQAADQAVHALHAGNALPAVSANATDPLVERIWKALTVRPLSTIERAVSEILLGHSSDSGWLSYQEIVTMLANCGVGTGEPSASTGVSSADYKAARALGLLSGRMKEHVRPDDYAGKQKPIEAFAARAKLPQGGIGYQLTVAGRAALIRALR